ncbi:MFS general substrate transporter [Laetiporus sulphureus 93-53]|uniref:MFS general substrate transporter n=1 Tax=Laetiporus sulphureus 93-53 TaxID=1314785 RepID=A0A165I4D3_9APHY|nr:MFS general substrate transporter [Laetiporus sulphureus 93-53]KZT12578.1 MFS general substrate transporter [Laetiporus sulphureus 93-53]
MVPIEEKPVHEVVVSTESLEGENWRMTRRVLWKLDLHVLPPLTLLWLANFVDRTNVGNARIAGLSTDLHLQGTQFNTALAVFYVSYILVGLPSNWILKKMKPSRWLPILVTVWGMVTTLSGLVQNFRGLVAIRFFLGMCEGGLLPGIMLYLSTLYKRHELQQRVGIFYASSSLAGAFGGLLALGIEKMDGIGNLAGWRWIFIIEGLVTICLALGSIIFLPADLSSVKFFTEEETVFACMHRFRKSHAMTSSAPQSEPSQRINDIAEPEKGTDVQVATTTVESTAPAVFQEDETFEWYEVIRGVKEPQVWMSSMSYLGIAVSVDSFSLFLPTIISGLGYSGGAAQLHTVPPYVPAVALTVVVAVLSDKLKMRGPFILMFLPISMAGYILAIAAKNDTQRYVAVFLMAAGIYPCGPCILSILPNNSAGHYKKATTVALQLAVANTGGFVATFTYTDEQQPKYVKGHSISLGFVIMAWFAMLANVLYCMWENRARAAGLRQDNIAKYQELWDSGKTRAPIGDRHPDFRFTL